MEYTDSQKTLISDLVMSIICSSYYWHKTISVCLEQSDDAVLKLLKDVTPWKALDGDDISKLGYWKRRKLKSLYFNPKQQFVIKHSKIIVGIYSQIRVKRENNKNHYIDGVKYTDFENNMYMYDFNVSPNTLFDGFDTEGIKQLTGEIYSCHTYINRGSNLPSCPNCNGKGNFRCETCDGTGVRIKHIDNYANGNPKYGKIQCGDCFGKGYIQCDVCHGSGKINIRSERYQELRSYKETQTALMNVLAKLPFSHDLVQLQYTPNETPLKPIHQDGSFEEGRLILLRKSAHNIMVDERNNILSNVNEIGRNILDLFYKIAYDESEEMVAYSSEGYLQIPVSAIICTYHNAPHVIYVISNYKKEKGIYTPVTTFITKALS